MYTGYWNLQDHEANERNPSSINSMQRQNEFSGINIAEFNYAFSKEERRRNEQQQFDDEMSPLIVQASYLFFIGRKEGNVLFKDTLNTFYLRLYGVRHMVKNHSDSARGNLLPPHGLLFPISSKGSFICIIPQTGWHIPQPLLHQSWITGWNVKYLFFIETLWKYFY